MNQDLARDLIMKVPREALEKEDVEVSRVTQVSGSEAIAETTLKTAFRLERVKGNWIVREVRIGHSQWEKVSNLLQALEEVRARETREMLDRIADAIGKYRQDHGTLPEFRDYIGLSDVLSPRYLTPLIRLDAWRRPLWAERAGPDSIFIRSLGPDGQYGTGDDIIRAFP